MLEEIKPNLYRINKNQYLKISKKGNGEITAPIKDPITKKFHWFNFLTGGSYNHLVQILAIIIIILLLSYGFYYDTKGCRDLVKNFRQKCMEIGQPINMYKKEVDNGFKINLSVFTETTDKSFTG